MPTIRAKWTNEATIQLDLYSLLRLAVTLQGYSQGRVSLVSFPAPRNLQQETKQHWTFDLLPLSLRYALSPKEKQSSRPPSKGSATLQGEAELKRPMRFSQCWYPYDIWTTQAGFVPDSSKFRGHHDSTAVPLTKKRMYESGTCCSRSSFHHHC